MNKIFLKGRLTATPELRQTQNGTAVTKFTIAVNRRFDREKTDFINCEAWRNTAEFICKYFTKGKEIALIGELHIDKSEKDGKATYFTTVVADEVEFCGGKGEGSEAPAPRLEEIDENSDLPF